MIKVMVFGDFDSSHEGHGEFLAHAKKLGDNLVAVISGAHISEHLLGELQPTDFSVIIEHLREVDGVDQVIVGKQELSVWELVREHHPDIIAVASDQGILLDDIKTHLGEIDYSPQIVELKEFEINPH